MRIIIEKKAINRILIVFKISIHRRISWRIEPNQMLTT